MEERFGEGAIHPAPRPRRRLVPRWILTGVVRLVVWVGVSAGVCVGAALLIGHFQGWNPHHSVPVALYIGGALLVVMSMGGLGGRSMNYPGYASLPNDVPMKQLQTLRGAYVVIGLALIGLGILLDWLL